MIVGKESEKLEFKKSTGEHKEGVISIASILNKHGGGELYFGVHNNGTPLGQDIGANTLRDVSQAIAQNLQPQIFPEISEVVIDNRQCIYVKFSGSDAPYFAYGRAYIRVADEDKKMSPAELKEYIIRQNMGKDTWDSELSDKTVDDVDESVLKRYIERANEVERIDFKYTTKEDALTRLKVLEDGKLKNAAAVWFCGASLLELQMAIFATPQRLTFLDINRTGGNVMSMMETAEKYIKINIRYGVEFDGSLQRKEIPEIPIKAFREAIINSYCHRDYKSFQNNEVVIYSDRVEIYNPGTFPLGFTPQDFIDEKGASVKRNPLLAQLMYYVKDVESFGTGIFRIANECKEADVKVDFEIRKMGFAVVFHRHEIHNGEGVDAEKDAVTNVVKDIVNNTNNDIPDKLPDIPDIFPDIPDISPREAVIFEFLQKSEFITNKMVCELLQLTAEAAKKLLQTMVRKNILVPEGENKGRRYKLKIVQINQVIGE